jgi:TonB family protein
VKNKVIIATIGLALLVGGSAVLPSRISAQDGATDTAKRKVRTRVTPEYPALAKQMNVTGKVKIEATVAADGHVSGTRVVGGSPLLVNAALDALKKWHFEPGPKETAEIVEFSFGGQE